MKAAPKKAAPKKAALPRKAAPKKAAAPAKKAPMMHGPRADYGKPVDGFFAKQPPHLRPVLEKLRDLIESEVPSAESAIKWGMPFYTIRGVMMCALGGHKSHVNLILAGPPGTFADPDGLLQGEGKTGRRLQLTSVEQIPVKAVRGWLKTAVGVASKKK